MFCSFLKKKEERPEFEEVISDEKDTSKLGFGRRKPKCATVVCIALVATLFFMVGLFQTFLAIYYVRESSRKSILALGPMFIGIGLMLYVGLADMCIARYRRRKRVTNANETPVSDVLAEEDKPAYAAMPRSMMISQIHTHQLPAFLTLTKEDLMRMGPEQKEQLLGGPLLMPPVVDSANTLVPLTFRGHLPAPKVPPAAAYSPPPPEEGMEEDPKGKEEDPKGKEEDPKRKEEEGKTEDSENTGSPRKIIQVQSESAESGMTKDAHTMEDVNDSDLEATTKSS